MAPIELLKRALKIFHRACTEEQPRGSPDSSSGTPRRSRPSSFAEVAALRAQVEHLRRECEWRRGEAERWRARAADLEARLQVADGRMQRRAQRSSAPAPIKASRAILRRRATEPMSAPSRAATDQAVDWGVFHLLGAGARELRDNAKLFNDWDNLAVDWSTRTPPKMARSRPRFWDRSLSLDWSVDGLPKVHFPKGKPSAPADALSTKPQAQAGPIDWDVLQLLSPASRKVQIPEENINWNIFSWLSPTNEEEELLIDWSGRYLPQSRPCRRRPGLSGAARRTRRRGQTRPTQAPPGPKEVAEQPARPSAPRPQGPQKVHGAALAATFATGNREVATALKVKVSRLFEKAPRVPAIAKTGHLKLNRPISQPGGRQGCHHFGTY